MTVTAQADNDYRLDYWDVDGTQYTGNSMTVPVSCNRNVQAVFVPTSYKYVDSIAGYDGGVYNPTNFVGWQNDGQYTAMYGWYPYDYTWISGELNQQATGRIFIYGYADCDFNVYTSSDGSNWNFVSNAYNYDWQGPPSWIDCGVQSTSFRYIKIALESYDYSSTLHIDSIRVVPT